MAKGFWQTHGRLPVAGLDFDPDAPMCQDDYEYYTDTGAYAIDITDTDDGYATDDEWDAAHGWPPLDY